MCYTLIMAVYSVYSIRNKFNGKRYIGLSYKPLKRMESHRCSPFPVGKAIRKYGWNNFDKRILKTGLTLRQAQKAERFYIAKYKSLGRCGYNCTPGGNARGTFVTSEITKERLRIASRKSQNTPKRKRQMKSSAIKQAADKHNMSVKEWKRINKLELRICTCGCNKKFKCKICSRQEYIQGHNNNMIGHLHSEKTKELISKNSGMHDINVVAKKVSSQLGISIKDYLLSQKIIIRICACGCKIKFKCKTKSKQRFINGHNDANIARRVPREIRSCACGCEQTFECYENSSRKWIHGHNAVGNPNARKAALARWYN